jgi:hypothetical protein
VTVLALCITPEAMPDADLPLHPAGILFAGVPLP